MFCLSVRRTGCIQLWNNLVFDWNFDGTFNYIKWIFACPSRPRKTKLFSRPETEKERVEEFLLTNLVCRVGQDTWRRVEVDTVRNLTRHIRPHILFINRAFAKGTLSPPPPPSIWPLILWPNVKMWNGQFVSRMRVLRLSQFTVYFWKRCPDKSGSGSALRLPRYSPNLSNFQFCE